MPRGQPDYFVLQTQTVRQTVTNEFTSSFNVGFSRLDGGGRIIWYDDFSTGIGRNDIQGVLGASTPYITYENGKRFGMSGSVVLDPVVNNGQSLITKYFGAPASGNIGLEFSAYFPQNFGKFSAEFGGAVFGDTLNYGAMNIEEGTGKIYLIVPGGQTLIYTPSNINSFINHFVSMKLVYSPGDGQYKSLLIGSQFIDLSGIYSDDSAQFEDGTVFFSFSSFGKSGLNIEPIYLGYVIISADEP